MFLILPIVQHSPVDPVIGMQPSYHMNWLSADGPTLHWPTIICRVKPSMTNTGGASDRVLADVGGFVQRSGEFPTRPGTSENWRDPLLNQHRPDSSLPARTSFEPSTNCSRRCRASGGNVRHRPVALVRGTRIGHWHLYSVRSHISDLPTARWVGVVWGPEYLTGSKAQEASQDIPIPDRVSRLVPIYFSMCRSRATNRPKVVLAMMFSFAARFNSRVVQNHPALQLPNLSTKPWIFRV